MRNATQYAQVMRLNSIFEDQIFFDDENNVVDMLKCGCQLFDLLDTCISFIKYMRIAGGLHPLLWYVV